MESIWLWQMYCTRWTGQRRRTRISPTSTPIQRGGLGRCWDRVRRRGKFCPERECYRCRPAWHVRWLSYAEKVSAQFRMNLENIELHKGRTNDIVGEMNLASVTGDLTDRLQKLLKAVESVQASSVESERTNFAKLEIKGRNSPKLTRVFRENMRNFDKILPRNFVEVRRNSAKNCFISSNFVFREITRYPY